MATFSAATFIPILVNSLKLHVVLVGCFRERYQEKDEIISKCQKQNRRKIFPIW